MLYHLYPNHRVWSSGGRRAAVKVGLGRPAASPARPLVYPLGQHSPLGTVVVPEATEHLARDHVADVQPDHPDDEEAVASEVVLGELGQHGRRPLGGVEGAQSAPHVLDLPDPVPIQYWTCPGQ